jgi:hypothetical protein
LIYVGGVDGVLDYSIGCSLADIRNTLVLQIDSGYVIIIDVILYA